MSAINLVGFAARKALLENVEESFTRGMKIYTVARAQAAISARLSALGH